MLFVEFVTILVGACYGQLQQFHEKYMDNNGRDIRNGYIKMRMKRKINA